jgi:hypothetical protein
MPRDLPKVAIIDQEGRGKKVAEFSGAKVAGLQRLSWPLSPTGTPAGTYRPVPPGAYVASIRLSDSLVVERPLTVEVEE